MLSAPARYFASHRIAASRAFAAVFFLLVLSMEPMYENTLLASLLFLAGLALVGVATVGRLWCSLYISGYKDSRLITVGPYSVMRHPLYFFSFLGFAGVGLATETLTLAITLTLLMIVGYPAVIRREETVLRAKFGAQFEAYRARTPALVPAFRRPEEPDSYVVNPRLFRRTMIDVVWFVWLVGIIELVEAMHELGIVEPLLALP